MPLEHDVNKAKLLTAIMAAVDCYRTSLHTPGLEIEKRPTSCSVIGCSRQSISKNLCNAHYLRKRHGKVLGGSIQIRQRDSQCSICGNALNGKGGWGFCAKHYAQIRFRVIKQALVDVMGGECSRCHQSFPLAVYDFHHSKPENKLLTIRDALERLGLAGIAEEAAKCELLCANCHRIVEHVD